MGGGGGGGGPYEPLDFEGVFTRSMRKLQRQVLKHTNRYRRMHGVRALKEDEKDACPSSPARVEGLSTYRHGRGSRQEGNLFYVVSVYEPRGNIMGQFAQQVPRPISGGGSGGGGGNVGGGHKKRRRHRRRHHYDDYDE
ncbi:hypothetical protein MTO96_022685 [Rhipicephalus appendiculatus]